MGRHWQLVSGAIGCGVYVAAGWLLIGHLVAGGGGPVDQAGFEGSAVVIAIDAPAATPADRGAATNKVLTIHVEDGSTYRCLVGAGLVSADAIMVTVGEFAAIARAVDCA